MVGILRRFFAVLALSSAAVEPTFLRPAADAGYLNLVAAIGD
jgi:hypothetical protein